MATSTVMRSVYIDNMGKMTHGELLDAAKYFEGLGYNVQMEYGDGVGRRMICNKTEVFEYPTEEAPDGLD